MVVTMEYLLVICALLYLHLTHASPTVVSAKYSRKEWHPVPLEWTSIGIPDPLHTLNLQIGLKQSNFEELERHLYEGEAPPLQSQTSS
jgi:tripeptidyl-peptidase I